ncbi:Hypothetical protein FKW44_004611 [Caligus rogercresseyi]|uniref:Uncharacterized protein n=1 Tax=Caligus rogercresseyi TaxID=217165 RepID=A0A7T8KA08_CALRO|nr:Hypothetical protein FKW44_004611 [Caligus rogercresseyi]
MVYVFRLRTSLIVRRPLFWRMGHGTSTLTNGIPYQRPAYADPLPVGFQELLWKSQSSFHGLWSGGLGGPLSLPGPNVGLDRLLAPDKAFFQRWSTKGYLFSQEIRRTLQWISTSIIPRPPSLLGA